MPRQTKNDSNDVGPIRTSSPRVGRMPAKGNRSPVLRQSTLNMSFVSTISHGSHATEPFVRDKSPSGESVVSSRALFRDANEESEFAVPSTFCYSNAAPHPAKLSSQQQNTQLSKRRSSGAASKTFCGLDISNSGDESYDGDEPKQQRRKLISVAGRPGRKPIGRRPNMDESVMKKILVPQLYKDDPFELVKKTRERILGECAQNFFKIYVGNQSDEACEINLYYRLWASYNMFFAHEPMSRLITSTRGHIVEIIQRAEDGPNFLAWNGTGMCTRSSVPPFKELSKFFQVKGQINGKEYSDKSPTTMNQLLVNVYDAVTHMEHMQQRFIPIGAAIIMNNWITLANPSDVIIALNRLRHFTRIALDYSAGPQINGNRFEFYFPEAARDLSEARQQESHPDARVEIHEPSPLEPNPVNIFQMCMVIPRSPMMEFIEYWTTFETKKLLKSSPLFAFKMAIRHRLFPMTMMRDALPPSIRDTYKDDLKNADQLDATPYPKNTLMDILKEISESGWKTLQMLLSRQTDTDEEKLLIQNHESSPLLKLAKFYIRSEQKYGDTYIPPQLFNRDDICIRERNLGGNRDLEFENEDNENHSMNVTGSAQDFDSVSIDWNTEII